MRDSTCRYAGTGAAIERHTRRKRCRIYIERGGNIESNASELEAIRVWHVENLLKFKEVFTPEIKLALEKLKSSEIEPE